METPAQRSAKNLIERISHEHTLNGLITGTRLQSLLDNCLEILSSQLYERSTHFLLELIQNADDNIYDCLNPTLSFSYKPGSLRIDCNEVGFTAENVEAICAISKSTKSSKLRDGEFIGEKGIGFKSVFKAADVVWISSREFMFKFDKTKFLGIVTPAWAEFPENTLPEYTSMYLQLSKEYEEETLINELRGFDTNLLIFLRRIKEISIHVAVPNEPISRTKVWKTENRETEGRVVVLRTGEETFQYLIREHVIGDLPREPKRPNWSKTKILLGFLTPLLHEQPRLTVQNVYAFLPIRSYGLKFLVQADFLLTASREDIESTLPWNRKIRDALPRAFLLSVEHFNQGELKYIWPCYLPSPSTAASTFLEPAIASILAQLKESPVLESCAGAMVKASSLKYVPSNLFIDPDGLPFTITPQTAARYLSSKYPPWAVEATISIGVSQLSPREFLEDLEASITLHPETFRTRSTAWHSQLADTLVKISTDSELLSMIQDICLIPLHDGTWTSARGQTIFFARTETSLEVPSGIDVLVVDSSAERDPNRNRLFITLGFKAWEAPELCQLILRVHESSDFKPESLALDQLISHAAFIYKASWQPPKSANLWFATIQGERCRGRDLYLPASVETGSPTARIFTQLQKKFAVIHKEYLKAFALDTDWPLWLVSSLGLSMIPRLITPYVDPKPQPSQVLEGAESPSKHRDQANTSTPDEVSDTDFIPDGMRKADSESFDRTPYGEEWPYSPTSPTHGPNIGFEDQSPNYYKSPVISPTTPKLKANSRLRNQNLDDPMYVTESGAYDSEVDSFFEDLFEENAPQRLNRYRTKVELSTKFEKQENEKAPKRKLSLSDYLKRRKLKGADNQQVEAAGDAELNEATVSRQINNEAHSELQDFSDNYHDLHQGESDSTQDKLAKLLAAYNQIDSYCEGIQVPTNVAKTTKYMYRQVYDAGSFKGESDNAIIVCCIYIACRQLGIPRTLRDVFTLADVPKKEIGKVFKRLEMFLAEYNTMPAKVSADGLVLDGSYKLEVDLSAPVEVPKRIFSLSEEFIFMFSECDSSDVLELLRDNWNHYSTWLDGAHMKWQSKEFVESSIQLKTRLGACVVQTNKSPLPLRETVLPMVDTQLDEGQLIPALAIKDPQHPEWRLLNYFDVLMKGDIHYYLRCIIAISEGHSADIDTAGYIYEQIQNRYSGNEQLISAAFCEREIILIHSATRSSIEPPVWKSMNDCLSENINLDSEYPTCSYLFRCLTSPTGDPIAPIVLAATLIGSSTKLEDISRLLRQVSAELKDINASKIAQLLRPLQEKQIFPITSGPGQRKYDFLLGLEDKNWFIADQPLIQESFCGHIPLLAIPIEDLPALENLFRGLRLGGRMLSKLVRGRTQPRGRTTVHWDYTFSLRSKKPFMNALIPQSHQDRATIVRKIEEVRVNVAVEISQIYTLIIGNSEIHGTPVRGQVSLSHAENRLDLFMTEERAAAENPPYELVNLIADVCGIKDAKHCSLLFIALSSSDMESISSAFSQQGIHIKDLVFDKPKGRHRMHRRDLRQIPNPHWDKMHNVNGGAFHEFTDATKCVSYQRRKTNRNGNYDRRLPMIQRIEVDGSVFENVFSHRILTESDKIDGWKDVQYLGEHMVSKLWQRYLGSSFDIERDWTSRLRSKSGYNKFTDHATCAAFTMRDLNIRAEMTVFLVKYGKSQNQRWNDNLRSNLPSYHVDVTVSTGGKASSFVITSSQIERMRQFKMYDDDEKSCTDIAVLARVSDIYSEDLLSVDLFVDPWRLFCSDNLTLGKHWVITGEIHESIPATARKRRKVNTPSIPWAIPSTSGVGPASRHALRRRMEEQAYAYRPLALGSIRLLYLLPGEMTDKLQGFIIHAPHKSAGIYQAVSYVWGSDKRTQELKTPDGVLRITSSLSKTLRGLRPKHKAVMLWMDAVCINQEDNEEKAQQIRLLSEIFQNAASVYAFLESSKEGDAAIEMLMQVRAKAAVEATSKNENQATGQTMLQLHASDSETETDESLEEDTRTALTELFGAEDWPPDLRRVGQSWKDRSIPSLDDAIWTSVKTLFALPWFRRVWIIQEVVAAANVKIVCGKWVMEWDDLRIAMEIVDREVQLSDRDFSHTKSFWEPFLSLAAQRQWEERCYRWCLLMLLEKFRYAESTLSRDRLFALLGLASDGNEPEFGPDYSSTLEQILLKFARGFVRQGRGMQLLYRAGLNDQSDRFPSWIPDWTAKRPTGLHDCSEGGVTFSASGPHEAGIKCIPGTDELSVEGYSVDTIVSISRSSNVEEEWGKYFDEIDNMIDSASVSSALDTPENLKWKVPVAGVLYPKVGVIGGVDLKSSYTALRSYLKSIRKEKRIKKRDCAANASSQFLECDVDLENMMDDPYRKRSTSYTTALQDTVCGWRFVIAKRGYAGVVPNRAKAGDTVAILKGGRVPFIVQKSETRPNAFRLVGECYIHGMMNGQGLLLPKVERSDFRLH